ncbi:LacI family DNA-binding transcriptional regulator [Subtercola sp. YIM 133946]|uniref:LacI family DNA-binding transcriptional regulator n=1 Tax=Subtercola sp. YIM 133946 TaxID=3118909 RepID=UPI002F92B250
MNERAGIKDVAAMANVSIKTVSRVINGVSTVEPAMRRRVEEAIVALNYVPNTMARSLKTGAGNTVGVVVDSIDDVFFSSLVSAIEDRAITLGLSVIIGSTGFDAGREHAQLLNLASQHVRGVILAPVGNDHTFLEPYRSIMPVVTVDRSVPGLDSVTVDDYAAARDGVARLVARGHRRIALIGYDPRIQTADRRRAAYEDVLTENGIALDPRFVPEVSFESAAATAALKDVLSLADPPTALFLANARHATSVISAMHHLGRTDLAVISFGDFALADAVNPAVSCIDQDPYLIGALAFERLVERFGDTSLEAVDRTVETGFVSRASHLISAPKLTDVLTSERR